ncbi:hypothetical protein JNW90_17955 [Micromonospora sp. STR1s_5]|nr:hypothetical protein [Micromonospora sp. STR1s_5]
MHFEAVEQQRVTVGSSPEEPYRFQVQKVFFSEPHPDEAGFPANLTDKRAARGAAQKIDISEEIIREESDLFAIGSDLRAPERRFCHFGRSEIGGCHPTTQTVHCQF